MYVIQILSLMLRCILIIVVFISLLVLYTIIMTLASHQIIAILTLVTYLVASSLALLVQVLVPWAGKMEAYINLFHQK